MVGDEMMRSVFVKRMLRDFWGMKFHVMIIALIIGLATSISYGMSANVVLRANNVYQFIEESNLDDGILYFSIPGGYNETQLRETIQDFPEISKIETLLYRYRFLVNYEFQNETSYRLYRGYLYAMHIEDLEKQKINAINVINGSILTGEDINKTRLLLHEGFVRQSEFQVGDNITIKVGGVIANFTIKASVATPEWIMPVDPEAGMFAIGSVFGISYTLMSTMEALVGFKDHVNEIAIEVKDEQNVSEIGTKLKEFLLSRGFDCQFIERKSMINYKMVVDDIEGDGKVTFVISSIIYLIGLLITVMSLNRLVASQKVEIGVDLSLGVPMSKIILKYFGISFLIGLFGALIGAPLGYYFADFFILEVKKLYILPEWNMIGEELFIQTLLIPIFVPIAAAIFPAARIARLTPAQALRKDPSVVPKLSFVKIISKVVNKILFFSINARFAVRNLLRSPRRFLGTIMGFSSGILIIIIIMGLVGSISTLTDNYIEELGDWDVKVVLHLPMDVDSLDNITRDERITDHSFELTMPATINFEEKKEQSLILRAIEKEYFLDMKISAGKKPSNVDEVVISGDIAKKYDIKIGDKIEISRQYLLESGNWVIMSSSVSVVGMHERASTLEAFMNWDAMQEFFGLNNTANQILIKMDKKYIKAFKRDIYQNPMILLIQERDENIRGLQDMLEQYSIVYDVAMIVGYVIALGILIITSMIMFSERHREFATLMAIGTSNRQMFAMLTWEASIQAFLGILIGHVVGLQIIIPYIEKLMEEMLEGFAVNLIVNIETILVYEIISFILAVASQVAIIFKILKINIPQAIKIRDF